MRLEGIRTVLGFVLLLLICLSGRAFAQEECCDSPIRRCINIPDERGRTLCRAQEVDLRCLRIKEPSIREECHRWAMEHIGEGEDRLDQIQLLDRLTRARELGQLCLRTKEPSIREECLRRAEEQLLRAREDELDQIERRNRLADKRRACADFHRKRMEQFLAYGLESEEVRRLTAEGLERCDELFFEEQKSKPAALENGLVEAIAEHRIWDAAAAFKLKYHIFPSEDFIKDFIKPTISKRLIGEVSAGLENMDASKATVFLILQRKREGQIASWLVTSGGGNDYDQADVLFDVHEIEVHLQGRAGSRLPVAKKRDAGAAAAQAGGGGAERGEPASMDGFLQKLSGMILPERISNALLALHRRGALSRIVILPSAELSIIPYAALPLDGKPLIDYAALLVAPDVDAISGPAFKGRLRGGAKALIAGNPDLTGDPVWEWPAIPGSEREAQFAANETKGTLLTGKRASYAEVRRELGKNAGQLNLIYFATHGIADQDNPMDGSLLALSGRHLYARDIKSLKLSSSPLVVMSACQTGLGKIFQGGVFGLALAWRHAGASQIVMSLWNVSDGATEKLMDSFVLGLLSGQTAERALQLAMIALKSEPRYADAQYWAPFTVYGVPSQISGTGESGAAVKKD